MTADTRAKALALCEAVERYGDGIVPTHDNPRPNMKAAARAFRDALASEPEPYVGGNCHVCGKHDGSCDSCEGQFAPTTPSDEEVARELARAFDGGGHSIPYCRAILVEVDAARERVRKL